ncbi:tRNA preQ1(34) S-adenosylmethionine ribosyltransferase-isomerase QueA [Rappaport israeli]|uniref:tRNA preQ1(34) S-adenosylmethionine ribosyltransferase-isomerase QueA n=1 Tax=Rappaport israeli TaxID=1839807 RepID=UPI000931D7BE|nr:tRNA preQ1(34) S-adenosylmethionine ribosyltransferase-isomerase QueA [Rappaport israeli]
MRYTKSDFYYQLPEALIARYPLSQRSASRMLLVKPNLEEVVQLLDLQVVDFVDLLSERDLLVFNNTKVLPARLQGQKSTGGKVEILVERLKSPYEVRAYLRASKTPKVGATLHIGAISVVVLSREQALFTLQSTLPWQEIMQQHGQMPIPPYLDREAQQLDNERYQTVYAKELGAVAAPTAGLHFDKRMLQAIRQRQIPCTEVTLHVGAGTFQPVREEDLSAHVMHEEWLCVEAQTVAAIEACKARGGRVIAIGTTSLRALESAAQEGHLKPWSGDTNLFITPGYRFKVVDALFSNFHLPESTLLMLVSAFAGYEAIREAYAHAIKQRYRFYSYGDAMFIAKNHQSLELVV